MSRYLSFSTSGTKENTIRHCKVTVEQIGRVKSESDFVMTGVISINGWSATVTITCTDGKKSGFTHVELQADSNDRTDRAADAAMAKFIRSYKDTNQRPYDVKQIALWVFFVCVILAVAFKLASIY